MHHWVWLYSFPITFFQEQLQKIWNKMPCHIVKARIGHFAIHQGSFHCLRGTNLLNDGVIKLYTAMDAV